MALNAIAFLRIADRHSGRSTGIRASAGLGEGVFGGAPSPAGHRPGLLQLDSGEQRRSGFCYGYPVYQAEYSRNLLFRSGGRARPTCQADRKDTPGANCSP